MGSARLLALLAGVELLELWKDVILEVAGGVLVADEGTYDLRPLGFGRGAELGLELLVDGPTCDHGEELVVRGDGIERLIPVERAGDREACRSEHVDGFTHLVR
jgi:hypothetical protein